MRGAALALLVLFSMLLAYFNSRELVSLDLGFMRIYRVPLMGLLFGVFIVGMLTMFLLGFKQDLKVRAEIKSLKSRLKSAERQQRASAAAASERPSNSLDLWPDDSASTPEAATGDSDALDLWPEDTEPEESTASAPVSSDPGFEPGSPESTRDDFVDTKDVSVDSKDETVLPPNDDAESEPGGPDVRSEAPDPPSPQ